MSKLAPALLLLALFTACPVLADDHAKHDAEKKDSADAGWVDLFNGEDLTGWTNPYDRGEAKVVDGVIELTANKKFFLTTEKRFSDFELEVQIMLPAEGKANSGIMYRCHVKPNKVFGYQAECDPTDRAWSGGLYDEGRRGWLYPAKTKEGKKTKLVKAPMGEWMQYRIKCVGDHLQVWVNGQQTLDFKDDVDAEGHIGLQHHGEKGQTYRFRNIRIKEIKAEEAAE
ncbi:MAG: 3-keto-disaccharide hydrolase [Phycisphaeraceae bacterium]